MSVNAIGFVEGTTLVGQQTLSSSPDIAVGASAGFTSLAGATGVAAGAGSAVVGGATLLVFSWGVAASCPQQPSSNKSAGNEEKRRLR